MRITGGAFRSRRLVAPPGTETRPTSDRVREALFSILSGYVALPGARVLDLYAGSGALSFEALSRGAEQAVLVDRAREAIQAIRINMEALGVAARTRVIASPVERALSSAGPLAAAAPFNLVVIDPPYADVASGAVPRALAACAFAERVAPGGVVVLEHASRGDAPLLEGLSLADLRRYGDTAISIFTRTSPEDTSPESTSPEKSTSPER